jgi:hypothetical protein
MPKGPILNSNSVFQKAKKFAEKGELAKMSAEIVVKISKTPLADSMWRKRLKGLTKTSIGSWGSPGNSPLFFVPSTMTELVLYFKIVIGLENIYGDFSAIKSSSIKRVNPKLIVNI